MAASETKVAPLLPAWAVELIELYESNASNQFIVHGDVQDRILIPAALEPRIGDLKSFLLDVLLPRFDVVLSYDLGTLSFVPFSADCCSCVVGSGSFWCWGAGLVSCFVGGLGCHESCSLAWHGQEYGSPS